MTNWGLLSAARIAAARGEHETLLGRSDALGQARTLEALYASAAPGQTASL
jgi:hypothetical protein